MNEEKIPGKQQGTTGISRLISSENLVNSTKHFLRAHAATISRIEFNEIEMQRAESEVELFSRQPSAQHSRQPTER